MFTHKVNGGIRQLKSGLYRIKLAFEKGEDTFDQHVFMVWFLVRQFDEVLILSYENAVPPRNGTVFF